MRSTLLVLPVVIALLFAGCGSGDSSSDSSKPPESAAGAHAKVAKGATPADRKISRDLAAYFLQTCPTPAHVKKYSKGASPQVQSMIQGLSVLCGSISYIDVLNGKISVQTSLEGGSASPGVGEAFCSEVQGSDVADGIDGHELLDVTGRTIMTCPARQG